MKNVCLAAVCAEGDLDTLDSSKPDTFDVDVTGIDTDATDVLGSQKVPLDADATITVTPTKDQNATLMKIELNVENATSVKLAIYLKNGTVVPLTVSKLMLLQSSVLHSEAIIFSW